MADQPHRLPAHHRFGSGQGVGGSQEPQEAGSERGSEGGGGEAGDGEAGGEAAAEEAAPRARCAEPLLPHGEYEWMGERYTGLALSMVWGERRELLRQQRANASAAAAVAAERRARSRIQTRTAATSRSSRKDSKGVTCLWGSQHPPPPTRILCVAVT